MFNMTRIGATIAKYRKAINMTQMELADLMGISFQAVSNWERGQSMPDISKLPELAQLFGVSIDELLGQNAPLIKSAAEGTLEAYDKPISAEEVEQAAPILKPDQVEHLADKLSFADSFDAIAPLLPFMSTQKVDALLQRAIQEDGDAWEEVAVFASSTAVDEAARQLRASGKSFCYLAPFMSTKVIDQLALEAAERNELLMDIIPFVSNSVIDSIALQGGNVAELAPFMSNEALNRCAMERLQRGEDITDIAPFLSTSFIDQIVEERIHTKE